MVVTGERRLLDVQDLSSNMVSLKELFSLFEQKTALLRLLKFSRKAQSVKVFIGGESDMETPNEVIVITAPYEVKGKLSVQFVIGPIRMPYERVIPIVDVTAKLLSNALSHH